MSGQSELFGEFPPARELELSGWKTFPGGLPYRPIDEKTTEIDFDGTIVRAVRGSGGRYSAPEILGEQRPRGFRNFMSKVALVRDARREKARRQIAEEQLAEARAREDEATERVFTAVESGESPTTSTPRCRNKLATARVQITEKRYINPFQDRTGAFNRVPDWIVRRQELSPLEKLVYGRLTFPVTIRKNDAGKKISGFCRQFYEERGGTVAVIVDLELQMLANELGAGNSSVRKTLASLANRALIEVGNEGTSGAPKTIRFLWHPWTDKSPPLSGGLPDQKPPSVADSPPVSEAPPHSVAHSPPLSGGLPPLKETSNSNSKKRVLAPDGERGLLEEIGSVVGTEEIKKNGGMWRKRMRGGQREIKALRNTIEDYRMRTPEQKSAIRNVAAWFTDRYLRNLVEIEQAEPNSAPA